MRSQTFISLVLLLGLFGLFPAGIFAQERSTEEEEEAAVRERVVREPRDVINVTPVISINQERSSKLSLHKEFNGDTKETEGQFSIEKGVKRIKIDVEGMVEYGVIKITLMLPSGKVYTDLSIDDSADMSWSTAFSVDESNPDYFGTWKYQVKATEAEGEYFLAITTY
jgi:hypothetical protein